MGTTAIVLHVTDSYSLESNAKSRQITVRTAEPRCEYSSLTVSKAVFHYGGISWKACQGGNLDETINNPDFGYSFTKYICYVGSPCPQDTYTAPNLIIGTSQANWGSTAITYTIRVNGSNCVAGDTLPVYTVLSNVLSGDTNSNQEVVNVIVGQNYNYTVSINSQQTGSRIWRFYVSGAQKHYNTLRNDIE